MSSEVAIVYTSRFEAIRLVTTNFPSVGTGERIFVRDTAPMPGIEPRLVCECASAVDAVDIADAMNRKHNGFPPTSTPQEAYP